MPAEQDSRHTVQLLILFPLEAAVFFCTAAHILMADPAQGPVLLLWVIKLHTAVSPGVILIQSNCSWLKQTHIGYLMYPEGHSVRQLVGNLVQVENRGALL
uniref:Uncharacterized protein n=1 Tax=Anguilla anguilla TaxID=7936 RepID=A0A0E9Q7V9_ANGAN